MKRAKTSKAKAVVPVTPGRGTAPVLARLKSLADTQRHAVLATSSGDRPHASLVAFALTPDRLGLLFATPRRTTKYRNMIKNGRVSLVVDNRGNNKKDYLGAEAFTINGRAREVRQKQARTTYSSLLSRKHPDLAGFVSAPTTALMLVKIVRCLHVGRFQTITEWKA